MSRDNEAQIKRGSGSASGSLAADERQRRSATFDPQTHQRSDSEASEGRVELNHLHVIRTVLHICT